MTDLEIMREIIKRDAAVLEALAHPTIVHCTVCDHEWTGTNLVCDWCGSLGKELVEE
jgi:hypothetical protein